MFKYLTKKCKQSLGFTLMEVMVVVGILAVIAGIAIPSVINMRNNTKLKERNDYAKAIFMAAQAELTEMRSNGTLATELKDAGITNVEGIVGIPSTYKYTYRDVSGNTDTFYDKILPVTSVDSTVRNGKDVQVIIEYHKEAGVVYSVFYYNDDDKDILASYTTSGLPRSKEELESLGIGYFNIGSAEDAIAAADLLNLEVYQISSTISYTNADEGTLTIVVPTQHTNNGTPAQIIPGDDSNGHSHLMTNLEVSLNIVGENGNSFNTIIKPKGSAEYCSIKASTGIGGTGGNMVHITVPIDSLKNGSFTDLAGNVKDPTNPASAPAIAPGDNVTITAEVTFYPDADDPIVMIESSTIAGINPMFHSLTQNPDYTEGSTVKPYILAVSNARHLQNLQHLDGAFAETNIDSIVFVAQTEEEVSSTPETTEPSTESTDPTESSVSKTRTASGNEDPSSPTEGSTPAENEEIAITWDAEKYGNFSPIDFSRLSYVPKIIGNGVKISNLKIEKASAGNEGFSIGLFSQLKNASISGITLVNPTITNNTVFLSGSAISSAATTGALIGSAESVTIEDCNIVMEAEGAAISGKQLVGGLVGHVKGSSSFKNCSVGNIPVADMGKTAGQEDKITYQLGGLVGYVEGSTTAGSTPITFTNCDTTAMVTAATASDLGGMVGKAENAKFDNCSTEATVQGAEGILSNIGGLVGEASNVTFTSCDADIDNNGDTGAEVTSGESAGEGDNKQHVGGLVGNATGGRFSNCISSSGTEVTSAENALSDIGGLVGRASGTTFTGCESLANVQGTAITDSTAIPNNNLGGFIGYSLNCDYTNTAVTLNDRPEYAADAGGFAGILKGGKVNALVVNLDFPSGNDAPNVNTITLFGGISSRCNGGAVVTNAGVTIKGTINNVLSQLAGAFAVTGGDSSATLSDIRVNLTEATIASAQTAGLIVNNGSSSSVEKSYVRGNVSGDSSDRAGFVFQNGGTITQCLANVTMSQGNAFVTVNNSTIKNCYGWVWDKNNAVELEIDRKCSYSYFVNGKTDEMVMYEGLVKESENSTTASVSGESTNIKDTAALADSWALDLLNAGTISGADPAWRKGSNGYDYPELSIGHIGEHEDPAVNGDYPYYIIYTETYSGDTTGTYTIFSESNKSDENKLDNSKTITSTSYLIYCRSGQLENIGSAFTEATYANNNEIPRLYSVYTQKSGEHFTGTVKINGETIALNTYCAPGGTIRTGEQFANIKEDRDGTFKLDRNITVNSTLSEFSGTLTNNGTYTITTTVPLINKFSGTLSGLNVDATITASSGTCGVLANTMTHGEITDCNISGTVSGSGDKVGGVVGEIEDGTLKNVSTSVTVTATGANVGVFAGYIEDGTLENCDSTADNNKNLPFAYFATRDIDDDATHYSTTKYNTSSKPKFYESDLESMGHLSETDNPTTIVPSVDSACSFKLNGADTPVIIDELYYYDVSEEYSFERNDSYSHSVSLQNTSPSAEKLTYQSLISALLKDENESVSQGRTTYFVGSQINNTYNRLLVSITPTTKDIEVKSTDSDGNQVVTTEEQAAYQFKFSSTAGTDIHTVVILDKESDLDDAIDLNGYSLHKISGSLDNSFNSGVYRIHSSTYGYLTLGASGSWSSDGSSTKALWAPCDGNTWAQRDEFSSGNKTMTVSFSSVTDDNFTGNIKIVINDNGSANTLYVTDIYFEYIALCHTYSLADTAYEVYVPNS